MDMELIEPIYEDDGLPYYGSKAANAGILLPFALTEDIKSDTPLWWFARSLLRAVLITIWSFTFGWILMLIGLLLLVIGVSYNENVE